MELVDIYDINKEKTGRTAVRGTRLEAEDRLLITHLCLFDQQGRMLAQRRSLSKSHYPGLWDLSAGGFVKSGEDALTAVVREAEEELGLVLDPGTLVHCLTEPFSYVFDEIFIAPTDVDPPALHLQEEELMDVRYFTREELISGIVSETFVDYPVPMIEQVFCYVENLLAQSKS